MTTIVIFMCQAACQARFMQSRLILTRKHALSFSLQEKQAESALNVFRAQAQATESRQRPEARHRDGSPHSACLLAKS